MTGFLKEIKPNFKDCAGTARFLGCKPTTEKKNSKVGRGSVDVEIHGGKGGKRTIRGGGDLGSRERFQAKTLIRG